MARPKTIFRTHNDFAVMGKTISGLTESEVRECMSDPSLTPGQWAILRNRYLDMVGEGTRSIDFFEGEAPTSPVKLVSATEQVRTSAKETKLVSYKGKMVDPTTLTSKQRTDEFGNENKTKGGAMSAAEYREFMKGVK